MHLFRADLYNQGQNPKAEKVFSLLASAFWAKLKGLRVLGTGAILNPIWQVKLQEELVFDEQSGLYLTKQSLDPTCQHKLFVDLARALLPELQADKFLKKYNLQKVFFLPQGTLRCVWKQDGKKQQLDVQVHLPNLSSALELTQELAKFGEVQVVGTPKINIAPMDLHSLVCGLDAKNFLVPVLPPTASDNDVLTEQIGTLLALGCALDLGTNSVIPAKFENTCFFSSSNAQKPHQLGTAYTLFQGEPSYDSIALSAGQTMPSAYAGFAGVYQNYTQATTAQSCQPSLPLEHILAQITALKSPSRKLFALYAKALETLGQELDILQHTPKQEGDRFLPFLGQGLERMRGNKFIFKDTHEGLTVSLFAEAEMEKISQGFIGTATKKSTSKPSAKSTQGVLFGASLHNEPPQNEVIVLNAALTKEKMGKQAESDLPSLQNNAELDDEFTFASSPEEFLDKNSFTPQEKEQLLPLEPSYAWSLDKVQNSIVFNAASPILVGAPAGTGKTRMLFARILHLLDEGIEPKRVVAVTRTRRAAAALDIALEQALVPSTPLPRTDTIYALALELWHKTHGDVPVLLSEQNASIVFAEVNAEESPEFVKAAFEAINTARQNLQAVPEKYELCAGRFAVHKNAWNLADYADLLEFWQEQILAGIYKSPWGHVLVDDAEDLTALEFYIIKSLLSSTGEGFFGLGNFTAPRIFPQTSIDDVEYLLRQTWSGLQYFSLDINYRSTPEILALAEVFRSKTQLRSPLTSLLPHGAPCHIFAAPNVMEEAKWIGEQIHGLLQDGVPASEIAVLVRIPELLESTTDALVQAGVPAQQTGQDAFWKHPLVELILSLVGRVYGIDIGERASGIAIDCPDKILAKGPLAIAAFLSTVPPFSMEFWSSKAFKDLCKAHRTHRTWAGLLTWVALSNEREFAKTKNGKVCVALAPFVKGLSFQVVFLPCMEDGLVPFAGEEMLSGKLSKPLNIAREQSWLQACIAMAEKKLFISHAKRRMLFGKEYRLPPSRFLEQMPKDAVVRTKLVEHDIRQEAQLRLF